MTEVSEATENIFAAVGLEPEAKAFDIARRYIPDPPVGIIRDIAAAIREAQTVKVVTRKPPPFDFSEES